MIVPTVEMNINVVIYSNSSHNTHSLLYPLSPLPPLTFFMEKKKVTNANKFGFQTVKFLIFVSKTFGLGCELQRTKDTCRALIRIYTVSTYFLSVKIEMLQIVY